MKVPATCSAAQLAEALGRSERWVLEAAAAGRIPSLKVGGRVRFTQEHVDAIYAGWQRGVHEDAATGNPWGRPAAALARSTKRRTA